MAAQMNTKNGSETARYGSDLYTTPLLVTNFDKTRMRDMNASLAFVQDFRTGPRLLQMLIDPRSGQ